MAVTTAAMMEHMARRFIDHPPEIARAWASDGARGASLLFSASPEHFPTGQLLQAGNRAAPGKRAVKPL